MKNMLENQPTKGKNPTVNYLDWDHVSFLVTSPNYYCKAIEHDTDPENKIKKVLEKPHASLSTHLQYQGITDNGSRQNRKEKKTLYCVNWWQPNKEQKQHAGNVHCNLNNIYM